ncbi:MAG: copper resistance protein NlpE N-terminal domain-containing protein [Dysgonamonadaceae bacterium]|jgi:uncharacterized lipoprotein NlpE involved in copper resistance|nr:copper resistance protein NlpE N-terminal domain-containing protein [Dysgonamonadaceae bacterium]
MKKLTIIAAIIIAGSAAFMACSSKKQTTTAQKPEPMYIGDNAKNKTAWEGTYAGTLPCADCEGIDTRVTLNGDGTYTLVQDYIDGNNGEPFSTSGKFKWSALGNTVTFFNDKKEIVNHFAVGDNRLTQLDMKSNPITGEHAKDYILAKLDKNLFGKRWRLTELNGKPVKDATAFITLNEQGHVNGNLGCNTLTGSYRLKTGNRIRFNELAITQKMCIDMQVENELKRVFDIIDSYSVTDSELALTRAKMAPLARFTAEYLQ